MLLAYRELLNSEEIKHLRCLCGVVQDGILHYLWLNYRLPEGVALLDLILVSLSFFGFLFGMFVYSFCPRQRMNWISLMLLHYIDVFGMFSQITELIQPIQCYFLLSHRVKIRGEFGSTQAGVPYTAAFSWTGFMC